MSRPISLLFVALSLGIAPNLAAQGAGRQSQVAIPSATTARVAEVKPKRKGIGLPRPSASQRAPDPSALVVVTTSSGERRLARAKKKAR